MQALPDDKPRVPREVSVPANSRATRVLLFSVLYLFVFVAFASGQASQPAADKNGAASANPQSAKPPVAGAVSSDASQYVGAEVCKTCHEEIYNAWEKTPHWKTTLNKEGGPSHQGCEGCHGPGAAHVAGGGDKTKIFVFKDHSPKEIDERCLTCHAGGTQHMNAINSEHAKSGVSCTSCHSPHHAVTPDFLLIKAQPELCYSCHVSQKPQ